MTLSRPLILALIGVALLAVTMTASLGARERATHHDSAASTPTAKATGAAPAARAHPPSTAALHAAHGAAAARADRAARTRHAARAHRAARAHHSSKPAAFARAIGDHRIVVLFLFQPGGYDDPATAHAVSALRGRSHAAVFTDRIDHMARYGPLLAGVDVARAPAVVIIDHHRRAHLLEGYIDSGTLRQEVADAR